jgi:phosphonoacetate hydrolase
MTRRRAMARTPARIPLFLLDGLGPDYLRAAEMPRLTALMRAGASTLQGSGVVPSLTNVNHVSLLTGTYPERHGLCANFYCDRGSGREVFMDEVTFVRSPLLFETVKALAWSTALVAGKAKLARLLGRGLDWSFDMDHVPADLAPVVGPPPEIFSMEINLWVLRLAREVARRYRPRLLYVATTDYPAHMWPPGAPAMQEHLAASDELIGRIVEEYDLDETVVALTADHGMNAKTRGVSPVRVLGQAGIEARGVPLIRDGLYAHHRDLGGALYLFLRDAGESARALEVLRAAGPGMDVVLPRAEAWRFRLPAERVGDLICFGRAEWALGVWAEGDPVRAERDLRSHGSLHEQAVPMRLAGAGVRPGAPIERGSTVDLAPTLCRLLGAAAGPFQGRVLEEALA